MDANKLLSRAFRLVSRSIDSRIKVDLVPADEQLLVEVDTTRLEQVLINICINARDAIGEGYGTIPAKFLKVEAREHR